MRQGKKRNLNMKALRIVLTSWKQVQFLRVFRLKFRKPSTPLPSLVVFSSLILLEVCSWHRPPVVVEEFHW